MTGVTVYDDKEMAFFDILDLCSAGHYSGNTIEKTNVLLLSKTLLSISITNFYIMSFHSVLYMFIHIITQPDAIENVKNDF